MITNDRFAEANDGFAEALNRYPNSTNSWLDCNPDFAATEQEVALLEKEIGYSLPHSYRCFLLKYGSASVSPHEIYGIVKDKFYLELSPNILWIYKEAVAKEDLPNHLLPIVTCEGDGYACLNLSQMQNNECPVILWESASPDDDSYILAEDFDQYCRSLIKDALESHE